MSKYGLCLFRSMWGIVGALQSVLKAKPNITVVMLYFRTAERLVISPVLEV